MLKKAVVCAALLLACVFPVVAPSFGLAPAKPETPKATLPAKPVASLPASTIDGSVVDIAAQKGWKVVYFWSDQCPCVQACERLSLIPLSRRYKGKVAFYGVASSPSNITTIGNPPRPALRTSGGARLWPPYDIVLDPKQEILSRLGAAKASETFLLDPQNRVVFWGIPDDSTEYEQRTGKEGFSEAFLADALAEALAGKKITRPVVPVVGCEIERRAK